VPTLPQYPKRDYDDYAFWGKIGGLMVQFLEQCFLAPSLKFNKLLSVFVIKGDKTMTDLFQEFSQDERPRNLSQFKTQEGVVCIHASPQANKFRDNCVAFTDQYEALYTRLCRNNKKVYQRCKELASLQQSSSDILSQLAVLL
jgi:hypothetical protein